MARRRGRTEWNCKNRVRDVESLCPVFCLRDRGKTRGAVVQMADFIKLVNYHFT